MKKPILIAEIGCNHKGELNIAKEMIKVAAIYCQVDFVKFQKRNINEPLNEEKYKSPHPNPHHSYGETYGEHRKVLELSLSEHIELKNYCETLGVGYSTSVWDTTSAKQMISLNPDYLKVPSACNLNFELLEELCGNFNGEIHLSLGMTNKQEELEIINFLHEHRASDRTILYSCVSGYPVSFKDISLLEISRLKKLYESKVKSIGFSGHHLGIAADIAAAVLGATHIERHFTLDRTWKGTDHAASLEPGKFKKLNRDLANVSHAMKFKENDILPIEHQQREKLKSPMIRRLVQYEA
ncbi:MAG: N-acetylneuraminate synthase family protein [Bdellovibrionales bacterium]|nr:N-acetylneuraminate synthase family protein [Bdellovibrionales bacterium]NQZ19146.1 N-acetylneuraminate synthase family protein [Bdellovibrionales bacterium]